ncbi:site-specific integrase [Pendulispora rubella]|uniref:Site-specific integrase n=1 Tax=Pendulispora rubella TaxID=2741070 RepID=A0ABZ2LIN9_9BACT
MPARDQKRILHATGSHAAGWRDHCIFVLDFGPGLRQKEIVSLDVGDVFTPDGKAKSRVVLRVYKRTAARNPPVQEVFLSRDVRAKLERLYELKRRAGQPLSPDSPIFLSRLRKRISTRQVRNLNAVWQRRAGIDTHYPFHVTRHNACTAVYRVRRDLRVVQVIARHADIRSSVWYTHPSVDEIEEIVESASG